MASVSELLKEMGKEYGDNVASKGFKFTNTGRIQTGIFPLDYATGGGIPRGRVSLVYGPESSLKSTVCYKTIGSAQRLFPEKKVVLIDIEGTYDEEWAAALGIDSTELIYVNPDYAEQAVDFCEAFLSAEDVSLVVLDSLASMTPTKEVDNAADKAMVGNHAILCGKLYRKSLVAMNRARKVGNYPAFIAINQIRYKIGVMMGNPETTPGGTAFPYGSSLSLRLYGKEVNDTKIHPTLAAWKECTGSIKKNKVPILANTFTFKLAKINGADVLAGQVYDWNTVTAYMKDLGMLEKGPKTWSFLDKEYPTIKAVKEVLEADLDLYSKVKESLINKALQNI